MQDWTEVKSSDKTCRLCAANMEEGFIADYTYGTSDSTIVQNIWVEGKLKKNWIGSAKLNNQKKFKITTFRCVNCGYLESFALKENF